MKKHLRDANGIPLSIPKKTHLSRAFVTIVLQEKQFSLSHIQVTYGQWDSKELSTAMQHNYVDTKAFDIISCVAGCPPGSAYGLGNVKPVLATCHVSVTY